jgi:DNA mismatch repair ATPase MutS
LNDKDNIKVIVQTAQSQLERLSLCTQKIKYKFGIINKNVLSIINRHNDINHFLISDETKFHTGGSSGVEPRERELCIVVDLESYYNKLPSFNADIRKMYVMLYAILNKVHIKELTELSTKLNTFLPVLAEAKTKYEGLQEFMKLLNDNTNTIKTINKQIKEKEDIIPKIEYGNDDDAKKSFKLEKAKKELEHLKISKTKSMKLYSNIKNKYNSGMLDFDVALMNSLLYVEDIVNNFMFLGLLKLK